mmetsp:Transcript_6878/g.16313  ORF Transcript_6878/g.16313 Transcript_6878/m.16313 type:complete len:215 (-) Transcript_6878:1286-1930(-)
MTPVSCTRNWFLKSRMAPLICSATCEISGTSGTSSSNLTRSSLSMRAKIVPCMDFTALTGFPDSSRSSDLNLRITSTARLLPSRSGIVESSSISRWSCARLISCFITLGGISYSARGLCSIGAVIWSKTSDCVLGNIQSVTMLSAFFDKERSTSSGKRSMPAKFWSATYCILRFFSTHFRRTRPGSKSRVIERSLGFMCSSASSLTSDCPFIQL